MIEVREITRSERILASWAISSSVMPSAKYSCSRSLDRLVRGSTASEFRAPIPAHHAAIGREESGTEAQFSELQRSRKRRIQDLLKRLSEGVAEREKLLQQVCMPIQGG